jgi:hypothetical protein
MEEEVAASIAAHAGELDEHGHRLVRRIGHARKRVLITGASGPGDGPGGGRSTDRPGD